MKYKTFPRKYWLGIAILLAGVVAEAIYWVFLASPK